ncbi:uncharacterized protein BCR38DRAFT_413028 [Pseudomassariella vexata]|uniref:Uncharacterized protein n=1 Tax=Pseudomassariella vexata TaxID=1141098 RepID=A0A1Y2DIQ0_9PEZI|nr:uncharacterized protein BCR38DRAFT_413028 [Pseudomassariella vexata]ORY58705.1 hypothetical protein BCR38DRAFT_413028 [Pseudomassariella vexata]
MESIPLVQKDDEDKKQKIDFHHQLERTLSKAEKGAKMAEAYRSTLQPRRLPNRNWPRSLGQRCASRVTATINEFGKFEWTCHAISLRKQISEERTNNDEVCLWPTEYGSDGEFTIGNFDEPNSLIWPSLEILDLKAKSSDYDKKSVCLEDTETKAPGSLGPVLQYALK